MDWPAPHSRTPGRHVQLHPRMELNVAVWIAIVMPAGPVATQPNMPAQGRLTLGRLSSVMP